MDNCSLIIDIKITTASANSKNICRQVEQLQQLDNSDRTPCLYSLLTHGRLLLYLKLNKLLPLSLLFTFIHYALKHWQRSLKVYPTVHLGVKAYKPPQLPPLNV